MSTTVSFRMDEHLKKDFEKTSSMLRMNVTSAITMFALKMTRVQRIPFEVSIDPFYSEKNMKYLEKVTNDIDSGKAKLTEHELIEEAE